MKKSLWKISVVTSPAAEDAVGESLGALTGKATAAYHNLEKQVSEVCAYSDQPFAKDLRRKTSAALGKIEQCGIGIGAGKIHIAKVRREDWAESWKKHFKAIEIGSDLLIKPSWIKKTPKKNQALVVLDPGLSFGTGQHATTGFCLSELVRLAKSGHKKSFLDIGTGSGILAIAAAKLGFAPIEAFDFDPESVRVAAANARTNLVTNKIKLSRGDITKVPLMATKKFDVVCANLISNLLIAERKRIIHRVNVNGTLVLAGILAKEFSTVRRAFETSGMKLVASQTEKEWRSGSFEFRKKNG